MKNLVPIYYPTMAVLVDDSSHFLEGISFKLDDKLAYQLYDKPYQLLQFLKEEYQNKIKPKVNVSTMYTVENIWAQIYNKKKYNEISVILVDYSMPSINGLDFCFQLKNLPIKKILVTGEADYEIAVRAFNDGLIDKFIRKDDYDFAKKINDFIFEMQMAYFTEVSNFKNSLIAKKFTYFKDSLFYDFFTHICNDNEIVEFYFLEELGGFILLDMDSNLSILLIRNESELADPLLTESFLAKSPYPFQKDKNFISIGNLINSFIGSTEQVHLFAAKKLKAEQTYYYSLIKELERNPIDSSKIIPYRQYLGL